MDYSLLTTHHSPALVAADVGNSRVKWGRFVNGVLLETASLPLSDTAAYDRQLELWDPNSSLITHHSSLSSWAVASVNPDGSKPFLDWLQARKFSSPLVLDDPSLLPLRVQLERPEAVGIDRLLNAIAVNARRPAARPAVIVDAGSAITVDAVSSAGAFVGGSIAIGLGLSARALHEFTYWLPLVSVAVAPHAVGKTTPDAMQSGLFWGTVGAVRELVRRVAESIGGDPVVYLTGGDGERLAPHLDQPIEFVPDMTLHGIYMATQHVRSRPAQ